MGPRIIDTTIHKLTNTQVMDMMTRFFTESRDQPIIIMTEPERGLEVIKGARVEFSRKRKVAPDKEFFGFRQEKLFDIQDGPTAKEVYVVNYHQTPLQQMKSIAANMEFSL